LPAAEQASGDAQDEQEHEQGQADGHAAAWSTWLPSAQPCVVCVVTVSLGSWNVTVTVLMAA
jgi:hypothetical protein